MYFRYFVIVCPWKNAGPFIWTNLNHLHPKMHWAKFGWNWPSGSGVELWKYQKFTTTTTKTTTSTTSTDNGQIWSPAMVTCPNEWKILEWDEELQTSKQINKLNPLDSDSACLVWFKWVLEKIVKCWRCIFTVAIIFLALLKDLVLHMNNNISIYFMFIFFSILCKSATEQA